MRNECQRNEYQLAAIIDLCEKIKLPDEVIQKVTEQLELFDFNPLSPAIDSLFQVQTGQEGYSAIQEQLREKPDAPFIWLTIYLAAALRTHEQYRLKGIGDPIFYETMSCFSRFVQEHRESYGVYGYDRSIWTYRQIAMSLFRLGTLEFEMKVFAGRDLVLDGVTVLAAGEKAISVHIPSDARLGGENCHESYRLARAFFQKYYPEFQYRAFYTGTWLLSPQLRMLLPPDANILNFQKDYAICQINENDNGYKQWLFKKPKLEPAEFPEKTSLQRLVKQFVLQGGSMSSGVGIVRL